MLKIMNVEKSYSRSHIFRRGMTPIVKDVSFECPLGKAIAIIGESGSGKSTLSRMVLGIEKPNKGSVTLNDQAMYKKKVRNHQISAVFQDYTSSLHPFQSVKEILLEVMCQCDNQPKAVMEARAIELLEEVGLSKVYMDKYPNMLSGGEAQRVAIARAICMNPKYILFDEAISSLDMSIQTQILDLLVNLRSKRQLSYIFITHDIQAATYLCEQLIIFKNGKIEEQIATKDLYLSNNAYTKALIEKQLSF
ncbi:ABC transporter ATP-binding protein [Staphylococcus pseudoxylosus]|uniref:ABC transporter ATP-binding protein n=1 Tax=Staphylococcus pseudoxylosus TaxID=2282419 RepID=A0AAQ0MGP0_9STAP|nr:ABC transporter ATP-binding protein [Staphylococcus pseudoxylosus]MCE5002493.1 ABC transporter ATP-binding protein [Staphylococcus pseudoxylosus]RMI85493.1 ABC transporter ATP-binding protein [Staphylococcus pseudoxylosus]